jgi:hypothetical protein
MFLKRFAILIFLIIVAPAMAQDADSLKASLKYGSKGFEFRTADNGYLMQLE